MNCQLKITYQPQNLESGQYNLTSIRRGTHARFHVYNLNVVADGRGILYRFDDKEPTHFRDEARKTYVDVRMENHDATVDIYPFEHHFISFDAMKIKDCNTRIEKLFSEFPFGTRANDAYDEGAASGPRPLFPDQPLPLAKLTVRMHTTWDVDLLDAEENAFNGERAPGEQIFTKVFDVFGDGVEISF